MKKTVLTSMLSILCLFLSAQEKNDLDPPAGILYVQDNSLINQSTPEFFVMTAPLGTPYEAGQEETEYRRNALYLEFLGPGILYSVNYERRISPNLSLRAGFTSWTLHGFLFALVGIEKFSMTAFPISVNYITGAMKSNHFEIGAGVMPSFFSGKAFFTDKESSNATILLGIASLGYRYQQPDGGFFFRVAITPLLGQNIGYTGGLSFGFVF